jgi:hypothetical protein
MSYLKKLGSKVGHKVENLYDNGIEFIRFNERGFSPFQFSSRMTQMNTSQLGGLIPNNPLSNLSNESSAWYEMWINPEKVTITREFINKYEHTAKSVVAWHFRPDVEKMKVSGACGWIAIQPQKAKDDRSLGFKNPSGNDRKWYDSWRSADVNMRLPKRNSPRIFLQRLRDIAEEAMYFVDLKGIEHHNVKFIKIFTKQYPDGMMCEGYYKNFEVPESGDDPQTINYSFEFIVERKIPIAELKKILGMFGSTNDYSKKTLSPIPGIAM